MCGILFVKQVNPVEISERMFSNVLKRQAWRGPDKTNIVIEDGGRIIFGHNRLSIIDPNIRSTQPMRSFNCRYTLIFNGEIYNHMLLRKQIPFDFRTTSDTETFLEGFSHEGEAFINKLEGMFAFVIFDHIDKTWIAGRDPFGIKPLFKCQSQGVIAVGSEAASLARLMRKSPCEVALSEWEIIRRPVPGASFFKEIHEILPGTVIRSDCSVNRYWSRQASTEDFSTEQFDSILKESVKAHEISDVTNVSLLSGGLDSAIITAFSSVKKAYTVGLNTNNEFIDAQETANTLERELVKVETKSSDLVTNWKFLAKLRGEPLSVPNEGLIYQACKSMGPEERVVLTGEGADEICFGYDNIYRWSMNNEWCGGLNFLNMYGYAPALNSSDRLLSQIEMMRSGKTITEFVEDFFLDIHLPGLLRRMDFASMAASKEVRVPFVCKKLINYMYRRPTKVRITKKESKLPLRKLAMHLGLHQIVDRKKIGFNSRLTGHSSRYEEYSYFQSIVREALGW